MQSKKNLSKNIFFAVSHEKICNNDGKHDEIREVICFTRRADYTLSGLTPYTNKILAKSLKNLSTFLVLKM